jgi:hypothetical protein
VSEVEVLNFLKKAMDIITKRLAESGTLVSVSYSESVYYTEHLFIPRLVVDDKGIEIPLPFTALRIIVRVPPDAPSPVYINIDRPVTDTEYRVVLPGTGYDIPRKASVIYLKAPKGFTTYVDLEVLGLSS